MHFNVLDELKNKTAMCDTDKPLTAGRFAPNRDLLQCFRAVCRNRDVEYKL